VKNITRIACSFVTKETGNPVPDLGRFSGAIWCAIKQQQLPLAITMIPNCPIAQQQQQQLSGSSTISLHCVTAAAGCHKKINLSSSCCC
jgi:hypothetical protein